jgi:fatty-acyl-CoA synthase
MTSNPFTQHLDKCAANYQPLTPLVFLERAAAVFPDHPAVVHGDRRLSYADLYGRSRRLASALARRGIGPGDTVSVMLANTPPMLEAHYGVPMVGAVLHAINTRLDARIVAFQLEHSESKLVICDREFAGVMGEALAQLKRQPIVVEYDDERFPQGGPPLSGVDYEALLAEGDPSFAWRMPQDEWEAIALNYTSGTTGNPKGVVYHHRGAHLMCYANVLAAGLGRHPVYLWSLPMFHCNGWCFPWTLSAVAGTHVCLRWVRAKAMYEAIAEHKVTHLCGAPIVMATLLGAAPEERRPLPHKVEFVTAAAPPPEAVLAAMAQAGFNVTHVYGLTETYGPAVVNEWHGAWDALAGGAQAAKKARQGVRYPALEELAVMDPKTMARVPADGQGHVPRQHRHEGLPQEPQGDRGGIRGGLVPFGRPRRAASGRIRPAEGSLQGHHHLRRREHLLDRGRGRPLQAPGGGVVRSGGQGGRQVGRDAVRVHRAQARRAQAHGGRDHRPLPGEPGGLQGAAPRGVRGDPENLDGEDPEIRAARAGQGRLTAFGASRSGAAHTSRRLGLDRRQTPRQWQVACLGPANTAMHRGWRKSRQREMVERTRGRRR